MDSTTMIAASSLVVTLLLAVKVISLQRQLHTVQKQLRDGLVYGSTNVTAGNMPKGNPAITYGDQASNAPLIVNAHLQAELRSLVENGQSIRAIKKLREATNLPLIEAKRMIDQLEVQIK
jgi:ribosomal protein L7/L12